ncbi:ribosomal N-lysine methyltransferase [Aspergillus terreus]|uniref:Ribosomal N-lysine methyltransferase n=1 Tax=Aspergillus terreus TaxID=33178 RepID=A0A5M3YUB7_ASPTE|nr:hypothetical protein ATETN484_0004039000 [Aspergillus terreus]GFF13280.1 ribosomal N-lysine methyltransferase [Aspergillus terreus]
MASSPGPEHEAFTQWALSHGVQINGIAPARFPGRGTGMVATRTIEENETILMVPPKSMVNIDTIPESFARRLPAGTSKHAIIAAYLTLEAPKDLDAWRNVWPQWADFEESMPILWPAHLRRSDSKYQEEHISRGPKILPPAASGLWNTFSNDPLEDDLVKEYQDLLAQQEERLMCAWDNVVAAFPDTDWETFVYHWLIVNSRSFYYVSPGKDVGEWVDALTLVPFADYFNHANNDACEVRFVNQEYTFTANRRYEKGEEIYMSYGPHSNDFLLVEYGFFLDDNPNDAIFLDDIILREFTPSDRKALSSRITQPTHEQSGGYAIEVTGPNIFITYAACLKYMTHKDWNAYIERGSAAFNVEKTAHIISDWVTIYLNESDIGMMAIQNMLNNRASDRDAEAERKKLFILLRRWRQIKRLCQTALHSLAQSNWFGSQEG